MSGTPYTPELVDKLLDKLATDDAFREEFQRDAQAALALIGGAQSHRIGGCLRPKHLASKEVIQRTRDKIRDALLGTLSHEVHCLEAV